MEIWLHLRVRATRAGQCVCFDWSESSYRSAPEGECVIHSMTVTSFVAVCTEICQAHGGSNDLELLMFAASAQGLMLLISPSHSIKTLRGKS